MRPQAPPQEPLTQESPGSSPPGAGAPPGRRRLWLGVGIMVALAAAVAWVNLSDREAPMGTSQPPPPGAPKPAPTIEQTPAAPPPVQDDLAPPPVEDFDAVARYIHSMRQRALADRRAELVDLIFTPQCDCYSETKQAIAQLLAEGRKLGGRIEFLRSELIEHPSPDWAAIRVVDRLDPYPILDETGVEVERRDGWPPTRRVFHLTRQGDRWLVWGIQAEGPVR